MKLLDKIVLLSITLAVFCSTLHGQTPQFSVGNYVRVIGTQNLNVRSTPGGTIIGSQAPGSQGRIVGGPTIASVGGISYVWYNVDWQSGVDGWSIQDGMGLITPPAPTLVSPGTSSSPGPVLSNTSQTFSWNSVSTATSYGLYIRDVTTNTLYEYTINAPTTSSTHNLIAGHNYRWNMQAFNGTAASAFSSTYYFQIATACNYSISPTSQSFSSNAGSGSVSVTAGTGCSWTAVSEVNWITITSGGSGIGNGTVNYSVAANTSTSSRTGTMKIAGKTFTVNQGGASCTYSISPTSQSFPFTGGSGSVSVTAGTGCSWTAVSEVNWITITSGGSGIGNGTVNYSVAANTSTSSRTGTIRIAGQTFTISQNGTGTPQSFVWPVDNPTINQPHACRGCLPKWEPGGRYDHGIRMHAGVDVWGPGSAYTVPVRAAADGWVEKKVNWGTSSRGLGNTVILRHANGKYTLYGHLDSFQPGLTVGQFISKGAQLGIMGHSSGTSARDTSFGIHVHFEVKDFAVLGNQSDDGPYWGYTPGHPDLYGYNDPRFFVAGISVQTISPIVLRNPPPGRLNIRGSPGTIYHGSISTSVIGQLGEGQKVVAKKRANISGVDWYFVDLPSRNSPLEGSPHPNNGPHGGWISGGVAVEDPSATQVQVVATEFNVRSAAGTGNPIIAKVYSGQRFVVASSPASGAGCSGPWYPIFVPGDSSVSPVTGWICSDGLVTDVDVVIPLPTEFSLYQNYPNPFNTSTTIQFALPRRTLVQLNIFNAMGEQIETLLDAEMEAGIHTVIWDAGKYASGIYFYRFEANQFIQTRKLVLFK